MMDTKEHILARVTYSEQESGGKKEIGFGIIRKVGKGTQHNWHKLCKIPTSLTKRKLKTKKARVIMVLGRMSR